ncbi:MAG TPA: amidase [Caulobacteraceae bacterium]|nr:amidase [Caulobacteraceae bacterium]
MDSTPSKAAEPATRASDIVMMDAAELADAIASRRVSCVEVMGAYLDHIDVLNPKVNAIVALQDREGLLAQARTRDEQVARGEIMGPLHGFPHAVKDLQWVKGIRSTSGSPILEDFVPTEDTLPVARMRAAGAIFIGKTNTPEFGLGSHTYNPVYGATRGAYDQARSAGGSSGGAAVSLALRLLPVADGSDYGGSLRNPAGWNNVLGFRTSFGVVPAAGEEVWLPSMGVTGPMARNVADLARLLAVQAGYDPRAPLSMPGEGRRFLEPLHADLKGRRVGWLGDLGGWAPYETGVLDVCVKALSAFRDLGCVTDDAVPDHPPEPAWQAFKTLRHWQAGGNLAIHYADPTKRALMKPEAVWEVENGRKLTAFDVTAASTVRTAWSNSVRRLFADHDFLIMPTAQVFAFDLGERWPREIANQRMATYHEWMKAVCLVTMSGCPSLAAPAGFGENCLPMGLQIIAPVGHEMDCLKLAHAYEAATGWVAKHPPPLLARA